MNIIVAHNFFATMILLDDLGIGILYLSPIYLKNEKVWKDHEIYPDIIYNEEQINKFILECKTINTENYVIIVPNIQLQNKIENISDQKMKFLVIPN